MSSNQDTITLDIGGKDFDLQVWYIHTPSEIGNHDEESFEESFEFTELYLPGEDYDNLCLMSLLGFEHVEQDIIKQLKEQKSNL